MAKEELSCKYYLKVLVILHVILTVNGFCVDLTFANSDCMHLHAELSLVKIMVFRHSFYWTILQVLI